MWLRPYGVGLPICTYGNVQGNHEVDKKVPVDAADASQYGRCMITLEYVNAGVPEVYSHRRQSVVKVMQLRVIHCMLVSRLCRLHEKSSHYSTAYGWRSCIRYYSEELVMAKSY